MWACRCLPKLVVFENFGCFGRERSHDFVDDRLVWGLGFRVLGLRVSGFGPGFSFRVHRVQDSGLKVEGGGFMVDGRTALDETVIPVKCRKDQLQSTPIEIVNLRVQPRVLATCIYSNVHGIDEGRL